MSGKEVRIVAIADFKAGALEKGLEAIKQCVKGSRSEKGNVFYAAHYEPSAPNRIIFMERWASQADISAHAQTPHFQNLVKTVEPLLEKPLAIHFLTEVDAE